MILRYYKGVLLILLTTFTLAGVLYFAHPLSQDPAYNVFADQRSLLGIPNFADVVSNLALIIISIIGVTALYKPIPSFDDQSERWLYILFFISVGLSGLGSAYYHLDPSNIRLAWDRLPIGLVNMTLVSAVISDRISHKAGVGILIPLVAFAIFSVFYWYFTDDLRLFAFVLFFPMIVILLLFGLYPTRFTHSYLILESLGWAIIMRLFEYFDAPIYTMTHHLVSGHPLKHLSATFAAYLVLRYTMKRQMKSVD